MIIPGKKLYLHGASDVDWGGDEMSMKSTTSAYLALGDYGVGGTAVHAKPSRVMELISKKSTFRDRHANIGIV